MLMNTHITEFRGEEEVAVTVDFYPVPAQRGYREPPFYVQLEPDEPAYAEDLKVTITGTGEDITDELTSEQYDDLAERAAEHMHDVAQEARAEVAIARAEEGRY